MSNKSKQTESVHDTKHTHAGLHTAISNPGNASNEIIIRGARTHNLKNIDLTIPKNKFIVITGLSGSGKSSLAFDTLYAEGQRRYVESLSAYARQFLEQMEKPDVDTIDGLSPAISIEQKSTSHNPRSTVGTVTEIYDYLRLLFARVGQAYCINHPQIVLDSQSVSQIVDNILENQIDTKLAILAPVISGRKGEYVELLTQLQIQGFTKVRIDGTIYDIDDLPSLDKQKKHSIEIVIDRFRVSLQHKSRITDSLETCLKYSDGKVILLNLDTGELQPFSTKFACPKCDYSLTELEPRNFSFNNPYGACDECGGLGFTMYFDPQKIVHNQHLSITHGAIKGWDSRNAYTHQILQSVAKHYGFDIENTPWRDLTHEARNIILYGSGSVEINIKTIINNRLVSKKQPFEGVLPNFQRRYQQTESEHVKDELAKYMSNQACPSCEGSRLRTEYRNVFLADTRVNLPLITTWQLQQCYDFFKGLCLSGSKQAIGSKIIKEILERLGFLIDVGLNYIILNRSAETLSGGEAQRIRLASQIGSGLTGVMYVLDEPSIGLHQRDNDRLIATLNKLRDLGNTVIVVEHDEDAIKSADFIVDIGPGAGYHGGHLVACGNLDAIKDCKESITGEFLTKKRQIAIPATLRPQDFGYLEIIGASGNNLKNINVKIPVKNFVCVTGVSGSGKSTLINDTLYKAAAVQLYSASYDASPYKEIKGLDRFDKVINVDQSPIGRTPRSNPATYTGIFTPIRDLFSKMPLAKERGYSAGRFSFNVNSGRCNQCAGDGLIKVEMHFLPDIYVICDSCKGKRYNRETLEVLYKGANIHQVLDMTVKEASEFFYAVPTIKRRLDTLIDVGLGYIKLGQSANTLSGGEAQRVKLSLELSRKETGNTLYILDEPTTGLHFYDIDLLLKVLHKLVDNGNSVVVIEHNLDVIKTADWIIDLGKEGGNGGGDIIAAGTVKQLIANKNSYTGRYLKKHIEAT